MFVWWHVLIGAGKWGITKPVWKQSEALIVTKVLNRGGHKLACKVSILFSSFRHLKNRLTPLKHGIKVSKWSAKQSKVYWRKPCCRKWLPRQCKMHSGIIFPKIFRFYESNFPSCLGQASYRSWASKILWILALHRGKTSLSLQRFGTRTGSGQVLCLLFSLFSPLCVF